MRFPTSLPLLCRRSALFQTRNALRVCAVASQPASSLSAVHHGLRQSQKHKPQGFNKSSLKTASPRNKRDPDWTPPTFKIKRGKKDVTDTGPKPQSRRSRFNDPEKSFGKRSLVYQMKHGSLKQAASEMQGGRRTGGKSPSRRSPDGPLTPDGFMDAFRTAAEQPTKRTKSNGAGRVQTGTAKTSSSRSPSDPFTPESFMNEFGAVPGNRTNSTSSIDAHKKTEKTFSSRESSSSRLTPNVFKNGFSAATKYPTKPTDGTYVQKHAENTFTSRGSPSKYSTPDSFMSGSHARTERPTESTASAYRTRDEPFTNRTEPFNGNERGEEQFTPRDRESFRVDDAAIRIPRATAASQFLYGRSVVSAAMTDSRRKLYKLYIYNGDDRKNEYDAGIEKLAREKGIKVAKVPNKDLRMLDKMSEGRPHNGYVLEASPLPQLPLKALGELSTNEHKFKVELAYQSSEEAAVNGTPEFVNYLPSKDRKPLVLLLDGILDPGNLGAILRTAAFLGVNEIAITKAYSAALTAVALKASSGASEVLTLFSVDSPIDFITRSQENGWVVYAAVPTSKMAGNSHLTVDRVESYDPLSSNPTVLVIGSEGKGLDKQIRRKADHEVSIPSLARDSQTVVDSLNVSVATGILCAAFVKKQASSMVDIERKQSGADLW